MKRISHSDDSAKFRRPLSTVYRSYPRIIYVIELAPEVAADPVFLSANPHYLPHMPCCYVGSSSQTAEQRFSDHLTGNNASIIAGKYAVKLRYDLMPKQKPFLSVNCVTNPTDIKLYPPSFFVISKKN